MPRRTKPRSEPACDRCGNEADLVAWHDGKVYCPDCLACGCDGSVYKTNGTCVKCFRDLHTIMTFEGPRLRNTAIYVLDAWLEYGLRAFELLGWSFEEDETIESTWDDRYPRGVEPPPPRRAPPHHRFTSSDGSP